MGFKLVKMNHNLARMCSCVCCGEKIPFELATKFYMIPSLAEKIREFCKPEFKSEILSYPNGCCNYCRRNLYRLAKGESISELLEEKWNTFKLDNIPYLGKIHEGENCTCKLCQLGKFNEVKANGKIAPKLNPVLNNKEKISIPNARQKLNYQMSIK